MIEKTSLKIFLTSGITVTVKNDETIILNGAEISIEDLAEVINYRIQDKKPLEFKAKIKNKYKDEKGKEKTQDIEHFYYIPHERISWYVIEKI